MAGSCASPSPTWTKATAGRSTPSTRFDPAGRSAHDEFGRQADLARRPAIKQLDDQLARRVRCYRQFIGMPWKASMSGACRDLASSSCSGHQSLRCPQGMVPRMLEPRGAPSEAVVQSIGEGDPDRPNPLRRRPAARGFGPPNLRSVATAVNRSTSGTYRARIIAIHAAFFTNGFILASWVSRLPAVRSHLGASEPELGGGAARHCRRRRRGDATDEPVVRPVRDPPGPDDRDGVVHGRCSSSPRKPPHRAARRPAARSRLRVTGRGTCR